MAWDSLIFGSLSLPSDMLESWLAQPVNPRQFESWPEAFTGDFAPCAPEVLMEQVRSVLLQPHELFELERDGGDLSVRAMLTSDSFFQMHVPLATLWRSAQAFQGTGSLQLFGHNTLDFAYRVEVGQGRSGVAVLSAKAKKSAKSTKQWREVGTHAQASLRSLLGEGALKKRGGEPSPFIGK